MQYDPLVEHTPGPWEIDGTGDIIRTDTGVNERGGMTGGQLVAQFWTRPTRADARVLVAGPDMLAALRAIVFQVAQGQVLERDACITQARAAIAKAAGGRSDG